MECYSPFEGIVLTDTFEQSQNTNPMDHALFPYNNRRIERQKDLDLRVILGNPPWSATDNREYSHDRPKSQRDIRRHVQRETQGSSVRPIRQGYSSGVRSNTWQ